MTSQLSDAERDALLTRILQAAAIVVEESNWHPGMPTDGIEIDVWELREALDLLPLSERLRYGL